MSYPVNNPSDMAGFTSPGVPVRVKPRDGVTNQHLANMPAHTLKANITGVDANPTDPTLATYLGTEVGPLVSGQVLTNNGTIPVWSGAPLDDGRLVSVVSDDMFFGPAVGAASATASILSTGFTSGTASIITQSSSAEAAGMSGALTLNTGTTTGGWAGINGAMGTSLVVATPPFFIGNSGQLEVTWWFKSDGTLSNGTDRYNVNIGFSDSAFIPRGSANCVCLYYEDDGNSGKFTNFVRVAGVTQSIVNSTIAYAINTLYVIKMVINAAATKVDWYITTYGAAFALTPDLTYTSSLPLSSIPMAPQIAVRKNLGTTPRKIIVDRWQVVTRVAR